MLPQHSTTQILYIAWVNMVWPSSFIASGFSVCLLQHLPFVQYATITGLRQLGVLALIGQLRWTGTKATVEGTAAW